MRTASMSLEQWKAEQAEKNLSADQKLARLTGHSETLRTRDWTDGEIMAIPENLLGLTFEQSDVLQAEFGDLAKLKAYREAVGTGRVRIAGVKR